MRKRLFDSALIVLFTLILIMCVLLMGNMIRGARADAEVRQIMAEAQDRIEVYEAANTRAIERPKLAMVTYAPLETPKADLVEDWYIEAIPLDKQLQKVVFEESCKNGVDYFTALGLIKVESDFCTDMVNPISSCYGLCQLNPEWFPTGLSPENNIKFGMGYMGELLERYEGDVQAALRAYNRGLDDGDRNYSRAVLEAAESIMDVAGMMTK